MPWAELMIENLLAAATPQHNPTRFDQVSDRSRTRQRGFVTSIIAALHLVSAIEGVISSDGDKS